MKVQPRITCLCCRSVRSVWRHRNGAKADVCSSTTFHSRVPLSLFLFIIACLSVGTETSHSRIADSRPPPTTTHSYIRMWKWSDAAISRLGNGVTSGFDKAVAFSPDENHVAFVSGNSIWIHDIKTASRLTQPKGGHVSSIKSLAYSPDGLILAAGTGGGKVQLWEVKSEDYSIYSPGMNLLVLSTRSHFLPTGTSLHRGQRMRLNCGISKSEVISKRCKTASTELSLWHFLPTGKPLLPEPSTTMSYYGR